MKTRLLHLLLFVTSLLGYMEWGIDNHSFLFQAEVELLSKLFTDPLSVIHPFTIIPLFGQALLIVNIVRAKPVKWISYTAISCIGLLFLMLIFIGLWGMNIKMTLASLPFILISIYTIVVIRKQ